LVGQLRALALERLPLVMWRWHRVSPGFRSDVFRTVLKGSSVRSWALARQCENEKGII
jgi:hypothetical protein